jgi:hypothetical protein
MPAPGRPFLSVSFPLKLEFHPRDLDMLQYLRTEHPEIFRPGRAHMFLAGRLSDTICSSAAQDP